MSKSGIGCFTKSAQPKTSNITNMNSSSATDLSTPILNSHRNSRSHLRN